MSADRDDIPETERLACAMEQAGAPAQMVERARRGSYDDWKSESATPIMNLVRDLNLVGLRDLAARAMNGEFDSSKEEAEAWAESEEGRANWPNDAERTEREKN